MVVPQLELSLTIRPLAFLLVSDDVESDSTAGDVSRIAWVTTNTGVQVAIHDLLSDVVAASPHIRMLPYRLKVRSVQIDCYCRFRLGGIGIPEFS
jgi:hypothetical protein